MLRTSQAGLYKKLEELAAALWSTSWDEIIAAEIAAYTQMGLMDAALELKVKAPPSSYDVQRRRNETRLPAKLRRVIDQSRAAAAIAVRQANQQTYPFSIGAQSITSMTRRMNVKDWRSLLAKRELLSRTTTTKLIRSMMECKPALPFIQMAGVRFFIYDQCYKKKGKSRGQHRAAEKVDASGDLVDLISMVIINSIELPIPHCLYGGITTAERNSLSTTGPYVLPFIGVLRNVAIDAVKASTFEFMKETGGWIDQVRQRCSLSRLGSMNVAQIARAAIGRPNVDGGRSHFRFNAPILNCDTKSHADAVRIVKSFEDLAPDAEVLICLGDGQSMLQMARLKRKFPDRYRHILIACGNFHAFGHFMFGGHESFFDCFKGYFARLLHKEKVPKLIPDFENDSYMHILEFDLPLAIGTLAYFVSDVMQPPPELFISDPVLYLSLLNHAGGIVSFRFLQNVGVPVLHWLRSGRKSDGDKVEKLHALAFHMNRATTHKVNCVLISLLAMLSTVCTHHKLSGIVRAMVSSSFTGKIGSLVYCDRMAEFLNLLQDERDGKFAAFERSLHFSQDMEAMLHVTQMWTCVEQGDSPLHDPVRQSTLNAAEVVRAELLKKCGSDLTIHEEKNPFWWTGSPVGLSKGSAQSYQPWEYWWQVAEGKATGKQRVHVESADAYIRRVISEEQLFPY